jgi:hypothetical protein
VLPWRSAPSRMPAFDFCTAWWERNGFTVTTVDSGDEPFSLAASRNLGVSQASGPVVIADADTVGDLAALTEALARTEAEGRTFLGYTEYRSLAGAGTAQAIAGTALHDCSHFVYPPAVSGLYVTTPATWFSYGGQDPRFKGWGPEDIAHMHAHETLVGPLGRVTGNAYALGHESAPKAGPDYQAAVELMHRYGDASGDPQKMRALVDER